MGQTNGNDEQWYPAFGTSMAAGAAQEEDKRAPQEAARKPAEAFTDKPASSNLKLMDFEAQLLLKAGK